MTMFTTPRVPDRGDDLTKDDLVGALAVFHVIDYDPETDTKYGVTPTITCDVTVVDGPHEGRVERGWFAAGNLAKQVGGALNPGEMAPGRVVQGTSANGRKWYGIEWATTPTDLQAAETALTPPTLGSQVAQSTASIKRAAKATSYTGGAPF